MSKRCELQKEYYKVFGNYKGEGKYTDHYVKWLEDKTIEQAERMYSKSNKIIMDFLDTEYELGISDKKTIERIKWYFETYFEQTYKENKQ